tara:strand:+ start:3192 stop:4319 length:1128 start_codon:yes stop_codon:yes gene_type:complete
MSKRSRKDSIFKKPKIVNNSKNRNNRNINIYKSFYKTFIASLVVIFLFFILPFSVNFFENNFLSNKIIINSSKKNFEETLKDKLLKKNKKKGKVLNTKSIFDDIDVFESEEENTNTSRLSASTIEQLFEDTNYSLTEVRETKLVNIGNSLDHLPSEMKNIESTKKKKKLFIQIVLPLIIEENTKIRLDRKKLFKILNKNNNNKSDRDWLKKKFKQYGVANNDLSTLKIRMDEIPVSLSIAQAAKETGWGTSRFAQEGNALFGQWTWSGDGIKPAKVDGDAKHKVARFKVLKASVKAYQRNLNTHSSYKKFRKERAIQRDNNIELNSLELVNYLDKYAETGIEYIKILKKIIKQNSLTEFDDVKILPTSKKLKNLI